MTGRAVPAEGTPVKGIEALWDGRKRAVEMKTALADRYTGEMMFLAGFGIYQIICMWATTMFPFPYQINLLGRLVAMGIVALKVLLYGGYRPWQLIGILLAGGCSAVTLLTTGYIHPFVWILFLAGSRDVPLKKILEVYLVITGAGMLLAYGASMLGIIENLQYVTEKRGIRNSFGIVYTTDFSAHIFYMTVISFYLLGERLRGWHYLGGVAVAALIWHYCNARLDTVCILLTVGVFWVGNRIMRVHPRGAELRKHESTGNTGNARNTGYTGNAVYTSSSVSGLAGIDMQSNGSLYLQPQAGMRVRYAWARIWQTAGCFTIPACAAAALALTWAYGKIGGRMLEKLNELSGTRLRLGWQGIEEHGFHLFGRTIESVGAGQTTEKIAEYFFVDSSYVNMFLRFGVLFGATVLLCYVISCRKNRSDLYYLYMIAVVAVNCMVAHHLMEAAYNPLLLAAAAGCARECRQTAMYGRGTATGSNRRIKLRKR